MIKNSTPISMAESAKYLGKEEKHTELKVFIKKFMEISPEKAGVLRKKLDGLGLIKLKEESISKIIDFLPEKSEDLNRIFNDLNLEEDEIQKILAAVKEYI
ncbi:MAG: hypothetical protein WD876_01065 [Candidatus Pacearchaeota archaeon]